MRAKKPTQLRMRLKDKPTWGGKRKNAGRKRTSTLRRVDHARRPTLRERHPVHVTWRLLPEIRNLRTRACFRVILRAFEPAAERFGVRVTHFSVQGNHVHVIVEADGSGALARAMQGLSIRIAKGINKLMKRAGTVFADRYHAHPLGTPTEARNAIDYVMNNARIHAARQGKMVRGDDEYAVGPVQLADANAFWRRFAPGRPPVVEPKSWLLSVGWRRARGPKNPLGANVVPA